jgi:hypothetical protein
LKKILYFTLATLGEVGKLISPYDIRFFVQPSFLNSFFPLTIFLLALFAEGRSLLFSFLVSSHGLKTFIFFKQIPV